jgi:hypothetical protein
VSRSPAKRLAVILLTCDRPEFFRSAVMDLKMSELPAGWTCDITVVDNSEDPEARSVIDVELAKGTFDRLVRSRYNAGIASGWNLGWGAVNTQEPFAGIDLPDYVALVQDDTAVDPEWFIECLDALERWSDVAVVSGYNSPSHLTTAARRDGTLTLYEQEALPGVHLVAQRAFWEGVFPLQTTQHHIDEDWEITKYSEGAPPRIGKVCGVLPGLVLHLGGASSTYGNEHEEYADPIREILQDGTCPTEGILASKPPDRPQEARLEVEAGPSATGPLAVLYERSESPEALGLKDHFGFEFIELEDAAQAMATGRPVLLRGWQESYRSLVHAYGSRCVFTWNSGWTGSELMGEDEALSSLLQIARRKEARLLWWEGMETVLPEGAQAWKPVWSPAQFDTAEEGERQRRTGAVLIGPHANPYSLIAKNSLASLVGAAGLGYEIHVSETTMDKVMPKTLQEVLRNESVVRHPRLSHDKLLDLIRSMWVMVHPSLSETWPALAVASVYSGTPVILSPTVVWGEGIYAWGLREACVISPATSTHRIQSALRRLVGNTMMTREVVGAQREALDAVLPTHVEENRSVLRGCEFDV